MFTYRLIWNISYVICRLLNFRARLTGPKEEIKKVIKRKKVGYQLRRYMKIMRRLVN